MTRAGHALLTLVGGACLALGCSGTTPRDQNFGKDAQSGFEVPPINPDAQSDGAVAGSTGTLTGTAGVTGTITGTAGSALTGTAGDTGALTTTTGGAGGGAGASADSGADSASDGARP